MKLAIALLSCLSLSCGQSSSRGTSGLISPAHHLTAQYQDGCTAFGYAAFVAPNVAVTASHLAGNLDALGRSFCSGQLDTTGRHYIPVTYNLIDGQAAEMFNIDDADEHAAVLHFFGPDEQCLLSARAVDGPAILVSDVEYPVQVVSGNWVGVDMPVEWAGAPIIQQGKLVGVAGRPVPGGGTLEPVQ